MRILIVDNNVELCEVLREFFETQEDLTVVGEAHDGERALCMIEDLEPDVVLLDITMPYLDGLGVLERLNTLNISKRPRIIVLTAFGKDDLISRMTDLGVDYFILKPFHLEVLAERVRQFSCCTDMVEGMQEKANSMSRTSTELSITRLLHKMGVPPHYKGFAYLREAVMMCVGEGYMGGGLTKEMYPALAQKFATTAGGVEAAIRNAVIAAWENGNTDYIRNLCGPHWSDKIPTNSLIIAKMVEEVHAS
ncbi:MAG: sporulation transcription factor Spo0A [Firmicutes bacterium]|mgnify:FL=1|nr:sporulation transcription factor Spo0A [Bacillota bacterium]